MVAFPPGLLGALRGLWSRHVDGNTLELVRLFFCARGTQTTLIKSSCLCALPPLSACLSNTQDMMVYRFQFEHSLWTAFGGSFDSGLPRIRKENTRFFLSGLFGVRPREPRFITQTSLYVRSFSGFVQARASWRGCASLHIKGHAFLVLVVPFSPNPHINVYLH